MGIKAGTVEALLAENERRYWRTVSKARTAEAFAAAAVQREAVRSFLLSDEPDVIAYD
jgi:hypothetical protein